MNAVVVAKAADEGLQWGTVSEWAGAIVTAVGVLAALWIAGRGERVRAKEQKAIEFAEARLFLVRGTGGGNGEVIGPGEVRHPFTWFVQHHGPHPVLDVYYEVWPAGSDVKGRPWPSAHREIAEPGEDLDCTTNVTTSTDQLSIAAWRVRWTDRYGNQWAFGEPQRTAKTGPIPYRDGDEPPPY